MCDYSLMSIPNRLAVPGDELVVYRFQTGTVGLAAAYQLRNGQDRREGQGGSFWVKVSQLLSPISLPDAQSPPAICIPLGARLLVRDIPMRLQLERRLKEIEEAVFIQMTAHVNTFRDAIRFTNGAEILLQNLDEGQRLHVFELSTEERLADPTGKSERSQLEYSFQFHL